MSSQKWHYNMSIPTLKDSVEYFRNDLISIKTDFNESSNNCIKPLHNYYYSHLNVLIYFKRSGKLMTQEDSPIVEYFPVTNLD